MLRLCSNSPTRAKILKEKNIPFIQSSIDFDEEKIESKTPKSFIYNVVNGKLQSALKLYNLDIPILVADTIICTNGEILRKAKNKDDAKEILLKQSGNEVSILTASILKSNKLEFIDISTTYYKFDKFDSNDLQEYLDSNEWEGKAGACMVEGFCKKYIKEVIGLESNAMGLPIEKIMPWLEL